MRRESTGRPTVYGSAVASQRLCLWPPGVGRYTKIAADSWGRAVCLSKRDGILHRDWFGSVRGVGGGWAGRGLEGHNPRRGVEKTEVGERMTARQVNGTPHGLWRAAVTWTLAAKQCVERSERDAPRFMCAICLCGSAVAAQGMYLIGDRPSAGGRGGGGIRGNPRCLPSLLRSPSSRSEVV